MSGITVEALWPSWELSLKAGNRSPATLRNYRAHVVGSFAGWLSDQGHSSAVTDITRQDIREYLAHQSETLSASTAATRFRCLRVFFRWCVAEDELETSPLEGIEQPKVDEPEVPLFSDEDVLALLAACDGRDFADRRDTALVRLLIDTGLRAAEIMSLAVDDIELANGTASVMGKGSRGRTVQYGNKTAQALDRYLRARRSHKAAAADALWLGIRGPMGTTGLTQMLRRRGDQADIDSVRPHRFRHTFAHRWLAAGGQEGDLQHLGGWATGDMIRRYGASAQAERARDAHKRLALGDQL
ncbi:MAG: tyrosine-type recombinase/integrase [Actinomycetota bacterium]